MQQASRRPSAATTAWTTARQAGLVLAAALAAACSPAGDEAPGTAWQQAEALAATAGATAKGGSAAPAAPLEAGPAPAEAGPHRADKLVLIAGGDVNLGRDQGQRILLEPGYDPLGELGPVLESGDLRFVNLESQLSDQRGETQSPHAKLVFTGPPGGADVLSRAGINVVSFANNHVWDYGLKGFRETLANLDRVGLPYAGVSEQPGGAYEPTVLRVKGWSIALFAVTHIWNLGSYRRHPGRQHVAWADFALLEAPLKQALKEHDLVLVSYHGGVEYADHPYPPTQRFVQAVMAEGVHVLLGHHPHVPQAVSWVDGRLVLHSLGNLVFGKRSDHRWERTSFLARITFHRDGPIEAEACPYYLRGHRPYLFPEKSRQAREEELRRRLERLSERQGGLTVGEAGEHSCLPLRPKPKAADQAAAAGGLSAGASPGRG